MMKHGIIKPLYNRNPDSNRRSVESRRKSYKYQTKCVVCSEPANRKGYCMVHACRRYHGYKYGLDTPKGYGRTISMINGGAKLAITIQNRNKPNRPEQRIMIAMAMHGIPFIHQWSYKLGVADFFVFPNIIVECDGNYWHSLPERIKLDRIKTDYLVSQGFRVIRLKESEIMSDIKSCVSRLDCAIISS